MARLWRGRTALIALAVMTIAGVSGGTWSASASALPRSVPQHAGDPEEHARTDLVDVPMSEIEADADPSAGLRPRGAPPRNRALAEQQAAASRATSGAWGSIIQTPVVPVFTALLPNGKVLMWDSVGDAPTESYPTHTMTRVAVFDPATNTSTRIDLAGANIFCAGFVQLADGRIFVAGGNKNAALDGIRLTHIFDWRTMQWTRGPDMAGERWYPSVNALMDGQAIVLAGGGSVPAEIRAVDGTIRTLSGITKPTSKVYPFTQSGPDGQVLYAGPEQGAYQLSWWGAGGVGPTTTRDGEWRDYGAFATYLPGLTLVTGGGTASRAAMSRTSRLLDTRQGRVIPRAAASMTYARAQHNLTILADGTLLATGGLSAPRTGQMLVNLSAAVYAAELWNPATNRWTTLSSAGVTRQYHSTALLLPDGRVLTGGGGICGACRTYRYLRKDVEIFSPPYLFNADGSPAARPVVRAPSQVRIDAPFNVTSPQAAQITKAGLIRLGAPTHSIDQSQRYIPLNIARSGTTLTLSGIYNGAEAPPGHYMLFVVNSAGVPSVAPIVQVVAPNNGVSTGVARKTGAPLLVYADPNRGGRWQSMEAGQWYLGRGAFGYIGNDTISSIDVKDGWTAEVCQVGNMTGCRVLPAGIHNTLPSGFDNTISSIRVRPRA